MVRTEAGRDPVPSQVSGGDQPQAEAEAGSQVGGRQGVPRFVGMFVFACDREKGGEGQRETGRRVTEDFSE